MRLDRNESRTWKGMQVGKYALLNLRKLFNPEFSSYEKTEISNAIDILERKGILEWGLKGNKDEFFVIKLRDEFGQGALVEYANAASAMGEKAYAMDILELAERAGPKSPFCKRPD